MTAADDAIERAYAEEWTRLLATLAGQLGGDVGLAEEAVADAFTAAVAEWPTRGVPARPGAWLTTVARRRAIDRLRREATRAAAFDRLETVMGDGTSDPAPADRSGVDDDRLRLLFTCCHPALSLEARVALTLRVVGGLEVPEVAPRAPDHREHDVPAPGPGEEEAQDRPDPLPGARCGRAP